MERNIEDDWFGRSPSVEESGVGCGSGVYYSGFQHAIEVLEASLEFLD